MDTPTLQEIAARISERIALLQRHPDPAVQESVADLLAGIDALHRTGITRLAELLMDARGAEILGPLGEDPLAAPILDLYGLLPLDEREQVEEALDAVRPYINSHGGEVEVLEVEEGTVHVRLSGSCSGCAGSTVTLQRGVEEALRVGFPGFRALKVHEPVRPAAPPVAVTLEQLAASAKKLRAPRWTPIAARAEIPPGTMRGFEVADYQVLLCNIEGEIYGFQNLCPHCNLPLHEGKLSGTVLLCPYRNCAYDARHGKRVDGVDGRLTIYPVALIGDTVQLALNAPGPAPVSTG